MDSTLVTVPQISISLAPPREPVVEPYSPFSTTFISPNDDDVFRPVHLTPPPTSTKFSLVAKPLSPLRPSDAISPVQGLQRERFEALLQASKERNSALGSKKECDLRKEIALKAHKNKQAERRALFLSKVLAPPSPTATLTPKTPPESPAIFHYSLPSPGLVSPLALFDSLNENPDYAPFSGRKSWIEKVDFRGPKYAGLNETPSRMSGRPLPSLEQISARLTSQTTTRSHGGEALVAVPRSSDRPRLHIGVGRLQKPVREPMVTLALPLNSSKNEPELDVKVPTSSKVSSSEIVQSNFSSLSSRERRAYTMLSTLSRRTSSFERHVESQGDDRSPKWKRHSAPADLLPLHERSGFEHPVLALPGGF
ncbi:hypothetical protein C0991_000022 [Blastosporella zonata]|nr:hypothetical protein C0991_000022 [Blastosporella zonata]